MLQDWKPLQPLCSWSGYGPGEVEVTEEYSHSPPPVYVSPDLHKFVFTYAWLFHKFISIVFIDIFSTPRIAFQM
jgi:hypothetical protein